MRSLEPERVHVLKKQDQCSETLPALHEPELARLPHRGDGVVAGIGKADHLGARGLRAEQE